MESLLVVFDLDGTLVDEELQMKAADLEAIARLRSRGARIAIATGRTYESAQPYLQALGIDLPVILCNGAAIWDPQTDALLYQKTVPPAMAEAVLSRSVEKGMEALVYTDAVNDRPCIQYLTPRMADFILLEGLHIVELGILEKIVTQSPPVKMQMIGDPVSLSDVFKEILTLYPQIPAVMTQDDYFEIMPPGVSKGAALGDLCDKLKIKLSDTLTFGDGRNDEELLVEAGFGVAMATSPAELKAKADFITADVAAVLRKLL